MTVVHEQRRHLEVDCVLADGLKLQRRLLASVPGLSGIPPFLCSSTLAGHLAGPAAAGLLRDLAHATPPSSVPAMPVYRIWQVRRQSDPVHRWLRDELLAVVDILLPAETP